MTSPGRGYYEQILRKNPLHRLKYRQCRWRWFYSAKRIRSFSWKHGSNLYSYRSGCLTMQKDRVSPDWKVPEIYNAPVTILLTRQQENAIRSALEKVPFSQLKTTPKSFVNLLAGGAITENFRCRFPLGFSYRFVKGSRAEELEPLARVLEKIAGTDKAWRERSQMEAWLFTEQRWDQLHPDA